VILMILNSFWWCSITHKAKSTTILKYFSQFAFLPCRRTSERLLGSKGHTGSRAQRQSRLQRLDNGHLCACGEEGMAAKLVFIWAILFFDCEIFTFPHTSLSRYCSPTVSCTRPEYPREKVCAIFSLTGIRTRTSSSWNRRLID